jgi:hypothetical protein
MDLRSDPSPHKNHRSSLSRITVWALLILGVMTAWWVFARMEAIAILDREEAAGLVVDWETPTWAKELSEKSLAVRLWPGSHVDFIMVDKGMTDLVDPAALGRAIQYFGTIKILCIRSSTPQHIQTLLQHMGRQPKLAEIDVEAPYNLDASIYPALARFTGLRILYLPTSKFNGEGFPKMPLLSDLTLPYTPITDQGLLDIMSSCPNLESILLEECEVSPAGLIAAFKAGHPNLQTFAIDSSEFSGGEVLEIKAHAERLIPHVKLEISND